MLRLVRNHARVSDLFLEMASRESDARMRSVIERANKETSTAIRCDLRAFQVTRSWCTVCFTPIFEIDMARVRCGAYKERVESSRVESISLFFLPARNPDDGPSITRRHFLKGSSGLVQRGWCVRLFACLSGACMHWFKFWICMLAVFSRRPGTKPSLSRINGAHFLIR